MEVRSIRFQRLSRRHLLRLMGAGGAAALLAGCGGAAATSPTAAGNASAVTAVGISPTSATRIATSSTPETALFKIPDTGAKLPQEKVAFRWVQSGPGPKGVFFKAYFAAYQQAHPNITVQLDELPWPEIGKIVPLGVQNGNAPDVFMLSLNIPASQWVVPLDDLIPDFTAWQRNYPPGTFFEGITGFNGKTYTVPLSSSKLYSKLLLYNQEYMQRAGYDPSVNPLTWDEFRAVAKKITAQGQGPYFGLIIEGSQTDRWDAFVSNLAQMAGAAGGAMNWKTGECIYTTAQFLAAIELLLALKADGSVFPGSLSLNGPQARAQMPQGAAGMILQGPWNIPGWQQDNPTFKFGVGSQPIPNSSTPLPLTHAPGGTNYVWAYSKCPYKSAVGDIFAYLGTKNEQAAWAAIDGIADPPLSPEVRDVIGKDPKARQAVELFEQQVRLEPSPVVRNTAVAQVLLEQKRIQPDFGQTVQGLYTGQLKDTKAAMQDLQDRTEAELARAIKAAQAKGAKVSRDDWKFANRDPTKDYTQADYDALKG